MNKIEVKHNLSTKHFRLYEYLKNKQPDEWTLQKEIALALPDVFPCTLAEMQDFHNSSCRTHITKTIQDINNSSYLPKPILSGVKGVKLANSEEFDKYIASNINSAVNRLKRLKKLVNKANMNNQYRLKLSEYQKDVWDCFLD